MCYPIPLPFEDGQFPYVWFDQTEVLLLFILTHRQDGGCFFWGQGMDSNSWCWNLHIPENERRVHLLVIVRVKKASTSRPLNSLRVRVWNPFHPSPPERFDKGHKIVNTSISSQFPKTCFIKKPGGSFPQPPVFLWVTSKKTAPLARSLSQAFWRGLKLPSTVWWVHGG